MIFSLRAEEPPQLMEEGILIDELAAYAVIERLWSLDWQFRNTCPSHVALMREYLRRSAQTTRALEATDLSPWNDPAEFVQHPNLDLNVLPGFTLLSSAPEYLGAGFDPLENRIQTLNQQLPKNFTPLMRKTCLWAVRWASLQRLPVILRHGLPDLYEPLLVLYERGGWFRTERGQVDFGGPMIPVPSAEQRLQHPPMASFESEALDALDVA